MALYLAGANFAVILLLNIFVSTVTVFFAPAELAMIPVLVPRSQLLAANGIFTLTLNAAFALGLRAARAAGRQPRRAGGGHPGRRRALLPGRALLLHAAGLAAAATGRGPNRTAASASGMRRRPSARRSASCAKGFSFIRANRSIGWSLIYLAITASLVGVLGVLGPDFAKETLGLEAKDFAVVVLPLGFGIVTGILLLNSYGRYFARRRVIEGGLIALGILLAALAAAGPISRFLQRADAPGGLDLSGVTSLLAVVVVIAFFAGIAYGLVAIPSQTQLQEDLPEDVRGRVFGVLGMLVSVASFLPIIIVGPISDLVGTTAVDLRHGDRRGDHRGRLGADARAAPGDRCAPGRRPECGRSDRLGARRRPADVAREPRRPADRRGDGVGGRPVDADPAATARAARRRADPAPRRTADARARPGPRTAAGPADPTDRA